MQELEYDEFGNMMKNTNPDFQPITYTGGLYDRDTKFVKLGARDYDPTIGRWTTKDPIGFSGGDTNLYAYVGGDPMSYVDPSGFDREIIRSSIFTGIPHDTLHIYDPKMPGNNLYIGFGPADGKVKVATNFFTDVPGFVDINEDRPNGTIIKSSVIKSSAQEDSQLLNRALDAQKRSIRGDLQYNLFSGPYNSNSARANCRTFANGL